MTTLCGQMMGAGTPRQTQLRELVFAFIYDESDDPGANQDHLALLTALPARYREFPIIEKGPGGKDILAYAALVAAETANQSAARAARAGRILDLLVERLDPAHAPRELARAGGTLMLWWNSGIDGRGGVQSAEEQSTVAGLWLLWAGARAHPLQVHPYLTGDRIFTKGSIQGSLLKAVIALEKIIPAMAFMAPRIFERAVHDFQVDLNADAFYGRVPLGHVAVAQKNLPRLQQLVELGFDIEAKSLACGDRSLVDFARFKKYTEGCAYLDALKARRAAQKALSNIDDAVRQSIDL